MPKWINLLDFWQLLTYLCDGDEVMVLIVEVL